MKKLMMKLTVVLCSLGLVAGACSSSDDEMGTSEDATAEQVDATVGPPYEVISDVVSHETTRQISVWAPDSEGEWPVVYAIHGTVDMGASRMDWEPLGKALASEGVVVFAADNFQESFESSEREAECAYRYARSIASDYGGDLDQPVTFLGHSLGASSALIGGLNGDAYGPSGTYDACFQGEPRPDLIVPIAGCHYEFEPVGEWEPDPSLWTAEGAEVTVVGLENDEICDAWQSEDLAALLVSEGHDATYVEIEGASHFAPLFGDVVEGEWVSDPESPGSEEVLQVIREAMGSGSDR